MYELSTLRLWHPGNTEEEVAAASVLTSALCELDHQTINFHSALSLITFSKEHASAAKNAWKQALRDGAPQSLTDQLQGNLRTIREWRFIASRDAVMTVYHFGIALNAISFKDLPMFREVVDTKLLRSARSNFQKEFPGIVRARDVVAHTAEKNSKEPVFYEGGLEVGGFSAPPGASFSMTNTIVGDRMTSTVVHPHTKETSVVSVPINDKTLAKLNEVKAMILRAFAPLEAAVKKQIMDHFFGSSGQRSEPRSAD
jgi:hypothetical protein